MGLWVRVDYTGDWWGEDPECETVWDTHGELYRSLAGIDKRRPWEALGRCRGRMYRDTPDGVRQHIGWVFEFS